MKFVCECARAMFFVQTKGGSAEEHEVKRHSMNYNFQYSKWRQDNENSARAEFISKALNNTDALGV